MLKLKVFIKAVLAVAISLYLTFASVLFFFQRDLVFPAPLDARSPTDVGTPVYQVIDTHTAEAEPVRLWFAPPVLPSYPTLVVFHGNGESQAMVAPRIIKFREYGYGVLIVGYRGYNAQKGQVQPSEEGLYKDARAAIHWLAQTYPQSPAILYGYSLGTGIATQMAAEGYGQKLILEAPYTRLTDVAQSHYPLVPVRLLMKDHFDTIDKVSALKIPVLVMMGRRDQVIPFEQGQQLYEAIPSPKEALWLDNADHFTVSEHGGFTKVIGFISRGVDAR